MKKVNVIGTTGSGKSTFSKELADKLACPYFQMDELFWKPSWGESTDEEFIPKIEEVVLGESWVLDGNYSRTNNIKWEAVDVVVWIDYSYLRTFFQLLKRTIVRAISKKELWPNTGNRESIRKSFFSKTSILIWFFRGYPKNKARYAKLQYLSDFENVRFVRLCSPKETRDFIKNA